MGRAFHANRRAIARVETENPVPVAALVPLAGAGVGSITRWIVQGWMSHHLDAFRRDGEWYSSVPAVARFLGDVARGQGHRAELAQAEHTDSQRHGIQPAGGRAGVPDRSPAAVQSRTQHGDDSPMTQQLEEKPAADSRPPKSPPKRSVEEIGEAVRRVAAEELCPVEELRHVAGAGPGSLTRWITTGYQNLRLDGVKRNGVWLSSAPAVARFLDCFADLIEQRGRDALDAGVYPLAREHEVRAIKLRQQAKLAAGYRVPSQALVPPTPFSGLSRAQVEQLALAAWCLVLILTDTGPNATYEPGVRGCDALK